MKEREEKIKMLLALDVGNTNIVLGVYEGENLIKEYRVQTIKEGIGDELSKEFKAGIDYLKINDNNIQGIAVSTVVPSIMPIIEKVLNDNFSAEPFIINPDVKSNIILDIDPVDARYLGADRIADAAAAYKKYYGPCIVIDFGTATTYDFITQEGVFIGGLISPGLKVSADALYSAASLLSEIKLEKPKTCIAKNGIDAILGGIIYGYVGQVEYLIQRMKTEFVEKIDVNVDESEIIVVATGGLSKFICDETDYIDYTDASLTLDGIKLLYDMNKSEV
jgi:type III pantothenate kinase